VAAAQQRTKVWKVGYLGSRGSSTSGRCRPKFDTRRQTQRGRSFRFLAGPAAPVIRKTGMERRQERLWALVK